MYDRMRQLGAIGWLGYKGTFVWLEPATYAMVKVIEPVLQFAFFVLIGRYFLGIEYVPFLVAGNAVRLCTISCVSGVIIMMRTDRNFGTLLSIMGTPGANVTTFAVRALVQVLDGLSTIVIGFIAGYLMFSVTYPGASVAGVALSAVVTALSTAGLGLFIGIFSVILVDVNLVMNGVHAVLLVLTGVTFPLAALPHWLQHVSSCLPLTWGTKGLRLALDGGNLADIAVFASRELLVGACYFLLAIALFNVISSLARRHGRLDMY